MSANSKMHCRDRIGLREPRRPIDIHNIQDLRLLEEWCLTHWHDTMLKGSKSSNAPTFHFCCLCFSRRNFSKKNSHPPLQSASILKLPGLKYATSHKDLYKWLLDRLKLNFNLGKKMFFPEINAIHHSHDDEDLEDPYENTNYLGKRLMTVSEELSKANKEIEKLREDNKRLLKSSNFWFEKYESLQDKLAEETPSYMETTPFKPTLTSKKESLLQLT